jgi:hypothetical protein
MAATKTAPASGGDIVEKLFDQAYVINEDQDKLNERRNGVRSSLRSLKAAGVLNAEQAAEVEDLYPTVVRTRKNKDDESDGADGK